MTNKEKIKLVIALPSLQCGGSEKYVSMLCRHINKERFTVILLLLDNTAPFYDPGNDVTIISLGKTRARQSVMRIRDIVRQHRPDIFLSAANHITVVMGLFRWMFPKNMLLLARESSLVSSNSQYARQPRLYKQLLRRCYKKVDHIICQSEAMRQDLAMNFDVVPEKMIVLHNPVEKVVAELSAPRFGDVPLLITVGRLSEEKGLGLILEALSLLDLPFRYHIIGDGDQREKLEEQVKTLQLEDKVFFAGQQSRPYDGVEQAALFLMASGHEGFPNSLLEAGSLGIPIVACEAPGGIGEIVQDGVNGFLVKERTATAYAGAILEALTYPFNREQISAATLERYNTNQHILQVERLLEQCYKEK